MTRLTPEVRDQLFEALLVTGGDIKHAARLCRISRQTIYEHRRNDREFARWLDSALREADQFSRDEAEEEYIRRKFGDRIGRMSNRRLIQYLRFLDARVAARRAADQR